MSHYFQQLLVSSGVRRPTFAGATNQRASLNAPDPEEVSEERIAPPAGPSSVPMSSGSQPPVGKSQPVRSGVINTLDTNQPAISKSDDTASGAVEILQPSRDKLFPATQAMSHGAAAAAPSPALPTTGTKVAEKTSPRTDDQESSLASVKQETPATVPTSPSRDELIEHVFRWVGENPKNIVPAALSHSTGNAELRKPSKQAVQPQPPSQPSAETAPFQIVQSSEPERSLPSPARPRPQPAAAENYTHETSVEISIGTLQIQVEAPPAASAKPSHRPVAPRTPNRRPVAAAQPPAIDINRLRRGFYL